MKKTFLVFIFLLLSFNFVNPVFSAPGDIGGFSCGLAGGPNGTDRCCSVASEDFDSKVNSTQEAAMKNINDTVNKNKPCYEGDPEPSADAPSCVCIQKAEVTELSTLADQCKKLPFKFNDEKDECVRCAKEGGVWSGLGCMPGTLSTFINNFVFRTVLGIAGGASLICIIYSVFLITTSRGNTEQLKKARTNMTNCILGLLLVIFAVFILNVIGKNILGIFF